MDAHDRQHQRGSPFACTNMGFQVEQEPGAETELQEGRKQSQNFLALLRSVDLDQQCSDQ